ncbi:glycosyltransferase family 4 protein [Pseudoalteromonas sp. NZS127_1]|uniref:glycosyltransferase n=1 Tax=unclassified Pseudoalteromonas TaxID=194690 RepID=UPI0013FDF6DF|nr:MULTISPECIES: glycosyltransferase [unclassified Pseudoalteromonas]MBG9995994.1 glycosyltransferase family 4 protein [Pseudoalteromonas sp. NZS127_1]MBH0012634.1 glycosyltransferase family 4 protein [Pseudoalteromonas sp. NZS100_1]MBH0044012.1 glycosyltransferase family 4 protein [Pseudoalteromonas sp. SWXJZ10B]MBH0051872.1 glycosyltransferase family 4 protein [Pseudoalteromonas sp. SWYJZ19]
MKKVLVIGYVWPEPNSSAAGTHMMSLLNAFRAQNWDVEFATPAQRTDHMVNLDDFGITSQSIALNCDSFDEYVKAYNPDIVMFDRFMMEEQFGWRVDKHCPHAIKILDTEDLQCLRNARHEAFKGEREFTTSDLHSDIAKREIAAILRCDLSLIISSYEMSLLNSVFKIEPSLLHHLPFMVDLSSLPTSTKTFEQRQHFMTIGNFRHAPNWDAVLYLQKIWPLIRKQLPKAELHIYGSYPPPKATALNNPKTGFLIKGWADNAFDVMQSARVCLAPLRFGAGIKGKLLEAMIMQTPSVTTNIGAEGMHNDLSWPGKIANTADDFANAAIEMYTNQSDFEQAQQDGNTLLNTLYDKAQLSAALIQKVDSISSDLNAHREKNFTGQMLKHHTMRSTQYMSQWIAEKNKKLD